MGTIVRYRCPKCGAPKTTERLHFILICDYCSSLVGFDDFGFEKSSQYQAFLLKQKAPATPGSIPHRLSVLYYQEMEESRLAKNRREWEKKAREYWRLYLEYYYLDFLVDFSDDPMCQVDKLVADAVLWYGTSYFDHRVSGAWRKYEKAFQAYQTKPIKNGEKTARRLMSLYLSLLRKLYQVISPEDLGVSCKPEILIGQSMQRWLRELMDNATGETRSTFERLLVDWLDRFSMVEEKEVKIRNGEVEVECRGCGSLFSFPAHDGAFTCPACGSSLRFLLEKSLVIQRRHN